MPKPLRLFLALPVDKNPLQKIVGWIPELSGYLPGIKWTEPDHLHLTLSFLGAVRSELVPQLTQTMMPVLRNTPVFVLEWKGLGCFPHAGRPRIIWLGISRGTPEVIELHERLKHPLRDFHAKEEPSYTPHVTLGRTCRMETGPRNVGPVLERFQAWSAGPQIIRHAQLVSSELTRRGPKYTVLATLPFE